MTATNRGFTINESITVLPGENKLVRRKEEIYLEPRIMRLLVLLCSKPGEVMLKSTLIETIWASKHINEEGLTKAISVLRKALENPHLIKTVPKQGYAFQGNIAWLGKSEAKRTSFKRESIPIAVASVAMLMILTLFSVTLVRTDGSNENNPSFEYTYMTYTQGLHLSPAISSTDLIAYVTKEDKDETFRLIVKSSASGDIIYQSDHAIGDASYPVFSPASDAIAFIARKSGQTFLNILTLANAKMETIYQLGDRSFSHVDWSPDGALLVFSDKPSGARSYDLYTYNLQTREVVQLTEDAYNEFNPVFSSDGKRIAFLQSHPNFTQKSLSVYSMNSGRVQALKAIGKQVYDHDWTDGDEGLLFTSNNDFGSFIHKLDLSTGDESIISNHGFSQVSVHSDKILACNYGCDNNLWMRSLIEEEAPKLIANSSRHELLGVLSPDKSSIVYISNRSGSFQLWLYQVDNESSTQLANVEGRLFYDRISWSPDSKSILVSVRSGEKTKILRISIENDRLETLLEDNHLNRFPNYQSADEFHFISDRSGKKELWSFHIETREITRLSHLVPSIDFAEMGGDGMIYFSKSNKNGIWRSTLDGNNEEHLMTIDENEHVHWELVGDTIYYLDQTTSVLSAFDTKNNTISVMVELLPDHQGQYARFSVANDHSTIIYNYSDQYQSDIVLLAKK